ncbi:MAG: hypothetical protein DMG97_04885 [Acidobacteria bacterium]|nr:MAG: hypothetical protein DMG97_04885 [Acidobacteriota bacterium]
MKIIATLLLASLPVPQVPANLAQSAQPAAHFAQQGKASPRKGGKWYFARTGHAVYCYGPVMTLTDTGGGLERVATFCKGGEVMVPLRD